METGYWPNLSLQSRMVEFELQIMKEVACACNEFN